MMTIRNVKIKEDDYGLTVTMPRTKVPHAEQYKDSVYFADKSMKQSSLIRRWRKPIRKMFLHRCLIRMRPKRRWNRKNPPA